MKCNTLYCATSPITQDCLSVSLLGKKELHGLLHYHDEFELTLISNADRIKLCIGNDEYCLTGTNLLLTAPGLPHALKKSGRSEKEITGVRIRFPGDLLGESFMNKSQLKEIKDLFQQAGEGIWFSRETAEKLQFRILSLSGKGGWDSFLSLLFLLHELSSSPGRKKLMTRSYTPAPAAKGNLRIDSIIAYMNANYSKPLFLDDVAKKANMTRGSFCRFIRKRTGKTYLESLNEIRIAHICQLLTGTSGNISEIAYKMGYNNVAYFHRFFKRQKGCTPKEYREKFNPGSQKQIFPDGQQALLHS
jgi:AraC-like DNA-binding protein